MFKGDFFVVDYKVIAQGAGYSDIVASDKIRCPNTKYAFAKDGEFPLISIDFSPPITYSMFKRVEIRAPKESQEA